MTQHYPSSEPRTGELSIKYRLNIYLFQFRIQRIFDLRSSIFDPLFDLLGVIAICFCIRDGVRSHPESWDPGSWAAVLRTRHMIQQQYLVRSTYDMNIIDHTW